MKTARRSKEAKPECYSRGLGLGGNRAGGILNAQLSREATETAAVLNICTDSLSKVMC